MRPEAPGDVEHVWRREAPHVVAALARRYGDFGDAEDAAQEALLAAGRQWPQEGVPDRPRAWLVRVASRRLVDLRRADRARAAREQRAATPADEVADAAPERDDTVDLLVLCCHPALTPASQVALTLRAVAGLTTARIAAALYVPEATMAQRISRAKATLRGHRATLGEVRSEELPDRLRGVLQVLYLLFTSGHTVAVGDDLVDGALLDDAVRLTRDLRARLPGDDEVAGLLALMLLTGARRTTRVDAAGDLVTLADQDRDRWDRGAIAEGVTLLEEVLPRGRVGPFQLQAAIAAVHAEAPTWAETDWDQIVALYRMLATHHPDPTVTLNLAAALSMIEGPDAGLEALAALQDDPRWRRHHRLHAVRGHLLEQRGDREAAATAYAEAGRLATNVAEQRYLNRRLLAVRH